MQDKSFAEHQSYPAIPLGGGLSPLIMRGMMAGKAEKAHLVMRRLISQEAKQKGIEFLDLGTDSFYPFFDDYSATKEALKALGNFAYTARRYPSGSTACCRRRAAAAR